ncbi:hypothetical protein KJ682_07990 [bacterium]|nr:hypothetical protein [bacterium]
MANHPDPAPHRWRYHLVVLALVSLASCGGSDDNPTSPGGGDDDPDPVSGNLLYTETTAVIDRASTSLTDHLQTLGLDGAMLAVATELRADTCVAAAEWVVPGDEAPYLQTTFINGTTFFMPVISTSETLPAESGRNRAPRKIDDMNLTGNTQALFMTLPGLATEIPAFNETAGDVGYGVIPNHDPQVEDFRHLDPYSLVYISTHGLLATHADGEYFFMLTNQPRDARHDSLYFASGELVDGSISHARAIFEAAGELDQSEWTNYVVSNRLVGASNGSFPSHTLMFVDACQSAKRTSSNGPPPMSVTAGLLGVQAFLGWTHSVFDYSAMEAGDYLFGHLLGDIPGSITAIPQETPPIRPAPLTDVFVALQTKGYHIDTRGPYGAVLELHDFTQGNGELLLRPSIGQLIVHVDPEAGTEELKLLGNFGNEPGDVTIASNPDLDKGRKSVLGALGWENDEITLELESSTHGYVVVETAGRRSNPHPLSRWAPEIQVQGTFSSGGRGPDFELAMNARWRAEIVDERPMPNLDPFPEYGWTSTLFSLESTCEFNYSGIFETSQYIYEYPEEMNSRSVSVHLGDQEMFFGTVTMKPSEGTFIIQANFSEDAVAMVTDKSNPEAPPHLEELPVLVSVYISGNMNPDGTIQAGSTLIPYATSWTAATPQSPPVECTGH